MPHPAMRHKKASVQRVPRTSGSFSMSMSSAIAGLSSLVAAKTSYARPNSSKEAL